MPAIFTVTLMSAILIKFVWKSKQKKRNFSGMSVFVTSCDSPLGFDVARRLDRLGFCVFAGFLMADGEAALRLKGKTSNRLVTVEVDVTDDQKLKQAVDFIQSTLGTTGLYCLINTANVALSGHFEWYTSSQCQRLMDVNVVGTIRTIMCFLPLLKIGKGRIINVTGTSGEYDYLLLSVQSASNAALTRFSNLLHEELEETGISVSAIEHEDGKPFTINLTEKEEINEMRLSMQHEKRREEGYIEEMYQWHRAQDARAKRSLKAEADLLKLELELIEDAVTSNTPKTCYSPFRSSKKTVIKLLEFLPRHAKSRVIKLLYE